MAAGAAVAVATAADSKVINKARHLPLAMPGFFCCFIYVIYEMFRKISVTVLDRCDIIKNVLQFCNNSSGNKGMIIHAFCRLSNRKG